MSKLSLKNMLLGVMACMGLMIAVEAGVGMRSAATMKGYTNDLATNWLPSMMTASPILIDGYRYRSALAQHILAHDAAEMARVEGRITDFLGLAKKHMAAYEANISEPEEKIAYPKIQAVWEKLRISGDAALAASKAGRKDEAEAIRQPQNAMMTEMDGLISQILQANERGAASSVQASDSEYATVFWLSIAMLALGLALFAAGVFIVISRVLRPFADMTGTMSVLANGDLTTQVPHLLRHDEIGTMAQAVQVFKENALRVQAMEADERLSMAEKQRRAQAMTEIVEEVGRVVEAAAQGDFSRRVGAQTEDAQMVKLVTGINEINSVVDRATSEFSKVLGAIAQGDLTRSIATAYDGRFGELKGAINNTIEKLGETLVTIKATATEVANSAREINAGADDLSRRTEGQASSLEETAATTEELAASVKSSAQASRQSVVLADDALKIAETGGGIVRQVVDAMQRIDQGSHKISDIISVIDAIAFQTNLLALNAAVEAARAGDAGKGFAVVASEVRTLAQRSSDAARDISTLINASNEDVGQGVKLVQAAGDALDKIMEASRKVSATVSEIATAAAEQANGIDEMSQAVAHMDGMTQQNAALSEESAASATALNGQIQRLNTLVATFRTEKGASSQAASTEPRPRMLQKMAQAAFGTRG